MTVGYEQARDCVRAATEPEWPVGTFCLDDRKIVENAEVYVFAVGAREWLIGGDASFAIAGAVPVVHKTDGQLDWLPSRLVATDPTMTVRDNPSPTLDVGRPTSRPRGAVGEVLSEQSRSPRVHPDAGAYGPG